MIRTNSQKEAFHRLDPMANISYYTAGKITPKNRDRL
jgi:hypothetical protein